MGKIPVKLILDKCNGRISKEDAATLDKWLSKDDNAQTFNNICKLWNEAYNASKIQFSPEEGYRKLEERLTPASDRRVVRKRIALAAAVAAAVIAIPATVLRMHSSRENNPVMTEISAPLGTHVRNRLPDGTIVMLNAGSVLRYNSGFGNLNRDVTLSGEGFFEVSKNEEFPFIVTAGGCEFKVLGTKFNISAYESEGLTAALMEGSLKVSSPVSSETMFPGEIVSIDSETNSIDKREGDVSQYKSWTNGFLRFESISLRNLVARLCREYNADIRLSAGELENKSLRISFNLSEPVGDILESLSSIIPVSVSHNGESYTITNK